MPASTEKSLPELAMAGGWYPPGVDGCNNGTNPDASRTGRKQC
jgi:hypothetical protein